MKKLPILALAIASLLFGAWIGLVRAGLVLPLGPASIVAHGPLLVNGFLGTLIATERAVALDERWAFAAPLSFAASAIALFVGGPSALLAVVGSALFLAASVRVVTKQVAIFTVLLALATAALLATNVLWLVGRAVPQIVLGYAAFLVLTIAAERLELGRMLKPSRASVLSFAAIAVALAASALFSDRAFGLCAFAAAAWLAKNDLARRTVRAKGLPRYAAAAMLAGYVWLAIAGAILTAFGLFGRALSYDAALHAIFLGFVMTMIFGHAPIVLPAVTGLKLPYRPIAWAPLALLHASVAVRVFGDLAGSFAARRWGALFNVVSVVLFFALTAGNAALANRSRAVAVQGPRVAAARR